MTTTVTLRHSSESCGNISLQVKSGNLTIANIIVSGAEMPPASEKQLDNVPTSSIDELRKMIESVGKAIDKYCQDRFFIER